MSGDNPSPRSEPPFVSSFIHQSTYRSPPTAPMESDPTVVNSSSHELRLTWERESHKLPLGLKNPFPFRSGGRRRISYGGPSLSDRTSQGSSSATGTDRPGTKGNEYSQRPFSEYNSRKSPNRSSISPIADASTEYSYPSTPPPHTRLSSSTHSRKPQKPAHLDWRNSVTPPPFSPSLSRLQSQPIPPFPPQPSPFDISPTPHHSNSQPPTTTDHLPMAKRRAPDNGSVRPQLAERTSLWRSIRRKPYDSPALWLFLYFLFNLGLTLYNKTLLINFPYPYLLTAIHALCGTIGCLVLKARGYFTPARLTRHEEVILILFSVLYTLNIAVSNVSLHLVTVPFHQVVRASTPLFTIIITFSINGGGGNGFLGVGYSKIFSLVPVVIGVGFATYGDYYYTTMGLVLTLLGTGLAALKTVITNVLQTAGAPAALPLTHRYRRSLGTSQPFTPSRLRIHSLDLLYRMCPMALFQCLIYAYGSGEMSRVRERAVFGTNWGIWGALAVNGFLAFGLNVVSFTANKKTSPLTMTVAGNIKQVLTVVLAVVIFDISVSPTNLLGILLTLAGGIWYGSLEYRQKHRSVPRMGEK